MKIGRNDSCPCGSGRKYKHCCFKKGITFQLQAQKEETTKNFTIREYFKKYHTLDLTATLAALTLEPSNHGKNLRLDYLTLESLASNNEAKEIIRPEELKKILDIHYPHYVMEDPPENMFTENVISSMGNNTVFGGNFEQGVFTLNQFIKVTNYYRESIPEDLRNIIISAQHILLLFSDLIAHRVGHPRNLTGEYGVSSEIIFPEKLEEYKSALWFDRTWLIEYCKDLNLDINVLNHFLIRHSDIKKNTIEINNIEENPLLVKPILELPEGFLVVSPTNIVSAMVHFILVQVDQFGCMKEFVHAFHKLVWDELMFYLKKIGYKKIPFEFLKNENIPLKSALFKFDNDKFALLTFSYDQGMSYNPTTPCHTDPTSYRHIIDEYNSILIDNIKKSYPICEILYLDIYSAIGRGYMLFGTYKGECRFVTTAFKFISLLKNEHLDFMTIWYFERAKERFTKSVNIFPMTSFLDLFSFYKKNGSFYINDEAKPTHLVIPPGEGFDIVKNAVLHEDQLVAYYKTNDLPNPILLPVIKVDEYILRYASRENSPVYLEFFIPEFHFDLWICSGKKIESMNTNEYQIYWEFNEAICYWLISVRSKLKEKIKSLSLVVLTLTYELEDGFCSEDVSTLGTKDPSIKENFKLTVNKNNIHIQIPKNIDAYISTPDNEGERILLLKILEGFGLLLESNGLINTLDPLAIQTIVDIVAPLGFKKMLLLLNTNNDFALDPRYLVEARYLQEANRQYFLDEIVPRLGDKCPPVGNVLDKSDMLKLTKNIVFHALLPRLKEILSECNSYDLLIELMALYESLLHENALNRIRTPTRMHCYSEREDNVKKIMEQAKLADETTLSVRCLIEHLAAEPTFGTKIISTQTIDDLIALMSLIIFWGSVGDQVMHDLFNVNIGILPSMRIGTNSREINDDFFSQFSTVRTKEFIQETTDVFSSMFLEEEGKRTVPASLDEVFVEDYGISISKLGGIMDFFALMGMEQAVSVPFLSFSEIEHKIRNSFHDQISNKEIEAALNLLCLKNREGVHNLPKEGGFDNNDISPWRYNRRLSYLQRPLILVNYGPYEDDPKILWTPRHMNLSWLFFSDLVFSGRFKAPQKSKLESKISKISQERRVKLQKEAFAWFQEHCSGFVEQEVGIGPKQKFIFKDDIGDIDILVIEPSLNVVLSIECKRTEVARNSKEMIEEVKKYSEYFKKHSRRHSWLENNKVLVSKEFGIDVSGFSFHSFFLTNEALAVQFMKAIKLSMPIISMYELRSKSLSEVVSIILSAEHTVRTTIK